MREIKFFLPVLLFCFSCTLSHRANKPDPYHYQINKSALSSKGVVVTAHPLASQIGIDILAKGGNAIDAAIATQLALAVVYPGAGNLGGGGFMVAHLADGRNITLDYREAAPGSASRDMYLDSAGQPVMERSQNGALSAGVPGTVAGLFAALPYAKLPFDQLITPAIQLAGNGFAVTAAEAASLNALKEEFAKYNKKPTAFQKNTPWKERDTLLQPALAATLARIRDKGQKGFYEGLTADLIVKEMERSGGIISKEDLKRYKAIFRPPVLFQYKGYEVISMPLPSSGGLIVQQCLKMMESRQLDSLGFHTPASVQLITEVERRAFADRATYMGDPDFVDVPTAFLASDAYLKKRMKDFQFGKAGNSNTIQAGKLVHESEETTHLSIADQWGNLVAVTTTLNGSYGSKTVVGDAGFLLNDEMDDFSVKPGIPNMYGAIGAEANAIEPGKRMLSSMTPTIVLKDQQPFMVVGTPGGTTIPTSVLQSIVNVIDFKLSPAEAVNQPKFHHQWLPDEVFVEQDFPAALVDTMRAMGYTVRVRGNIGRTELIKIEKDSAGTLQMEAIADKRGDDDARGL